MKEHTQSYAFRWIVIIILWFALVLGNSLENIYLIFYGFAVALSYLIFRTPPKYK